MKAKICARRWLMPSLRVLFIAISIVRSHSAVVLMDAETQEDVAAWNGFKRCSVNQQPFLPILGDASAWVQVTPPKSPATSPRQTASRLQLPVSDWRPYDRLVLDALNNSLVPILMRIEAGTASEKARRHFALPAGRWVRIVLPAASFDPELADLSRVKDIRIAFSRQSQAVDVYLDNLVLLSPGEKAPDLSPSFLAHAVRRLKSELDVVEQSSAQTQSGLKRRRSRQIADWCGRDALESLREIRRQLDAPARSPELLAGLGERIDHAGRALSRIPSIVAFDRACDEAGSRRNRGVLVGVASSMVKLMPRELPVELEPAKAIRLSAARNETESVQVAVLPLRSALSQVSLRAEDLRSATGQVLPRERIDCDVMGYVQTREQPHSEISYVGWWPDPILNFIGPVKIQQGDLQSFWVRVRVPKEQPPGLYRGNLSLGGPGLNRVRIPLTIQVRSFSMPDFSPLPTAISFGLPVWKWSSMLQELAASPQWNEGLKYKWADFLANYYISYDHLYRRGAPDVDIIAHLAAQGRLGAFNLGNFDVPQATEGDGADPAALEQMLKQAGIAREQAKGIGVLDHAYIYGFDEVKEEKYAALEETAAALKRALPDVMVMTTALDNDFGANGRMAAIDSWCPNTVRYDPAKAASARERGDQVWWYIAIGSGHPYANIFLEYPAIETRLLMGAMTAKYRPDGFLYYHTSLWGANEPIKTGPFSNWDPRSYRDAHGDGSWVCMREGGLPVPTIRLENFRDGLEDLAYVRILEEAVRIKESGRGTLSDMERRWLAETRAALQVPASLVSSLTEYSREPARVYAWRERLATLIEASQERPLDPWAGGFSMKSRAGQQGTPDR